jgi:hypothetical protein
MADLNDLSVCYFGCNYAVFLDRERQHSITFIIDMLADKIDTTYT